MKTKLLLSILGITALASFGQGVILLDNYNTYGPEVTYGGGYGGLTGMGLGEGWTMGFYYALGDATGLMTADPSGVGNPAILGPLTLGTGSGSTAEFYDTSFGLPGEAMASRPFVVPGTSSSGGEVIALVLVAYNGANYLSTLYRGHSTAFTMTTSAYYSANPNRIGDFMPGFSVFIIIPEPSVLAFVCLLSGSWLLFRRQRS